MNSSDKNIQFPQYRRYKNGLSYFKILSVDEFEEIRIVGSKSMVSHVVANQYPEKVFINDLLYKYADFAEGISEKDYLAMK